jgi:hypothetical protein
MKHSETRPTAGIAIPPGFVSRKMAARRLGIALKTLDRWIQTGKVEPRLWLNRVVIPEEFVEAWCRPRPYVRRRWKTPAVPAAPCVASEAVQTSAAMPALAGS